MSYHSRMKKQHRTMPKKEHSEPDSSSPEVKKTASHPHEPAKHPVHHHTPSSPNKGGAGIWPAVSFVLAVLLIASIFTRGFAGSSPNDDSSVIENAIDELNTIKETASEEGYKTALDSAIAELEAAKDKVPEPSVPPTSGSSSGSASYSGDVATLEFYVMSQCPYGTQVMDAIAPVLKDLDGAVDFEVNYIATPLGDGQFNSLHGANEVQGDIVQLCAAKYNPDKYMDMIVCQDQNAAGIPDNWESCAQQNGLDVEKIRTCYEGEEGAALLEASAQKSQEAGATGSPTMRLNGKPYQGGRGELDFMRAICAELDNGPEACQDIPEPAQVNLLVLNDERCAECDVTSLISQLKGLFPGLTTETVDYSTDEGKALYESTGVTYLPALFFDDSVEEGAGYSAVQAYLVDAGDYRSLRIAASFDPTKEICDNGVDDTGNGLVDCDDPDCTDAFECRPEIQDNLQVFIMSDCPYGKLAVEALKEVKDNFGDDLNFEIHYIASEDGNGGFSSLHGSYEADEDMIQLCTKEHSPDEWFDYVYCRSVEGIKGNDWKNCAEQTGVDIEAVQACFDGSEGKQLLGDDIMIAQSMSIGASPTWLANNRYTFSGIDAETVKTNFCKYNPELAACENTLTSDTGGVASGSC